MDVKSAVLNGFLKEEFYVEQSLEKKKRKKKEAINLKKVYDEKKSKEESLPKKRRKETVKRNLNIEIEKDEQKFPVEEKNNESKRK